MDFNDINKSFSRINKGLNKIDKEIKQHKKENKQQMNNDILRMLKLMSEDMQRYNANEKSIQLALKGTYEFFKIAAKVNIPQSSINRLAHTDNIAQQNISSYGTPLSEVATQQLTWLWEKRIPQGKITLLEGDPGMSKSLLAIDIAAHISTGRPLPGDTAGKKGSVILIASEDGAADTIKPRMEAAAGDLSQILLLNTVESLDVKDVQNENGFPYIEWLGENNLDISTLIGPGINLSFPRQEIIKVLKDASTSLDLKTIAERTGQNYKTLRMTVSRMHEAGLIARPFRGKYTTLEQDAERKKAHEIRQEAFRKSFATDADVTTDANTTDSPKESSN